MKTLLLTIFAASILVGCASPLLDRDQRRLEAQRIDEIRKNLDQIYTQIDIDETDGALVVFNKDMFIEKLLTGDDLVELYGDYVSSLVDNDKSTDSKPGVKSCVFVYAKELATSPTNRLCSLLLSDAHWRTRFNSEISTLQNEIESLATLVSEIEDVLTSDLQLTLALSVALDEQREVIEGVSNKVELIGNQNQTALEQVQSLLENVRNQLGELNTAIEALKK